MLLADRPKRLAFCDQILQITAVEKINLEDVVFYDEAHFDLYSPNFNFAWFFLCGHLKSRVYIDKPADTEALKTAIRREISTIKKKYSKKLFYILEKE